jgi:hypothetical protein
MNVKSLLVAASIVVATSNAFAADSSATTPATSPDIASQPASPSTLTRAQVHAEVLAARAAGTLPGPGDDVDYPSERGTPTGRFDAAAHPYLAKVGNWFKSLHASAPMVGSN